jgi:hypothetical protein
LGSSTVVVVVVVVIIITGLLAVDAAHKNKELN